MSASIIGRRIRALRKSRRWSAQKLSDLTDGAIGRSSIAEVETGRTKDVTLTAGIAIAKAFGLSVEALMDEEVAATTYAIAHEIVAAKNRLAAELHARQR